MIETHLFPDFVPVNTKYLLLGSFVAKKPTNGKTYDWYYDNKRNHFWPIMEAVFQIKLPDTKSKQKLFSDLGIAVSDIISQCERRHDDSSDLNLINIVYNIEKISDILHNHKIEKILFTSRFVEVRFRKVFKQLISEFPKIELITLPSPSPRYAKLTKQQKVERYLQVFDQLCLG